jgi:hypothetical protein
MGALYAVNGVFIDDTQKNCIQKVSKVDLLMRTGKSLKLN